MSAELYLSAEAMAEVIDVPVDTHCQARIVCIDAPVGVATGDANVNNRFHPTAVVYASPGDNAVLMCEDCHEWLREAYAVDDAAALARIAAVEALRERVRSMDNMDVRPGWPKQVLDALDAALAASPTPTGPEPAQETKPKRCAGTLGDRPSWMSEGQFSPCRCELLYGHDGECQCEHTRPSTPEPTEVPDAR